MASTGEVWKLGHRPALDGVRGIAVLLVMYAHTVTVAPLGAGETGVTMFFTLSGFLITALLLEELQRTGRVDLAAFWARRVRRLVPALSVMLALVGCASAASGWIIASKGSLLAAFTYTTNWVQLVTEDRRSGVAHTWSLAVEEHFYLVWPLVVVLVAARFGRRGVTVAAGGGIVAATVARLALWDGGAGFHRVYVGSDTRADGLLIGCLIAACLTGRARVKVHPVVPLLGLGLIAVACALDGTGRSLLGPSVASVAAGLLLLGDAGGTAPGWLQHPALRWAGLRSYGIYLWHYPIGIAVIETARPSWVVMVAVVVPSSLLLAELSWRFVEQPVRRWRRTAVAVEVRPAVRASTP